MLLNGYTKLHHIKTRLFTADAADPQELANYLKNQRLDLVISDVPYGQRSKWQQSNDSNSPENPLTQMLNALLPSISADAVVAIVVDKAQTFSQKYYRQVEKFQIGKRRIVLLKLEG